MRDHDDPQPLPVKVTLADIQSKVKSVEYVVRGVVTTCYATLENGYVAVGHSACVDPREFSVAVGEKYAYEDAIDKIWPLEGYLLRQRRHEAGLA